MHEIGRYLVVVLDKWFFWVGIVFLIPEMLKTIPPLSKRVEHLPRKLFWFLAASCVFIATFQAWNDEHTKVQNDAVYVIAAPPELVRTPQNPLALSVGQKLQVNITWGIFGQHPAKDTMELSHCYLADTISNEIEDGLVKSFKEQWEDILNKVAKAKGEGPTIFPNHTRFATCDSDTIITQDIRDAIKTQTNFLYVVGALRFNDSLGEHESPICSVMEAQTVGEDITGSWHDCHIHINQFDVVAH